MDNLKNILLSEISTVESYLDRLFHALLDMRQMRQLPELKELCARFDFDLGSLFESKLLRDGYVNDRIMMITPSELRERVNSSLKLVTSLILMDFNPKQTRNFTVEYINLLYSYAYELHVFSAKKTNLHCGFSYLICAQELEEEHSIKIDSSEIVLWTLLAFLVSIET